MNPNNHQLAEPAVPRPTFHLFLHPTDQEIISNYLESKILQEYNPINEQMSVINLFGDQEPWEMFNGGVLICAESREEKDRGSETRMFYTERNHVNLGEPYFSHGSRRKSIPTRTGVWSITPCCIPIHGSSGEVIGSKDIYFYRSDNPGHFLWFMEEYLISVEQSLGKRLMNECVRRRLPSFPLNWRVIILRRRPYPTLFSGCDAQIENVDLPAGTTTLPL